MDGLIGLDTYGDIASLQLPVRELAARLAQNHERRLGVALLVYTAAGLGVEALDEPTVVVLGGIDRDGNATALALGEAIEGVAIGLDAANAYTPPDAIKRQRITAERNKLLDLRKSKSQGGNGTPKRKRAPRQPYDHDECRTAVLHVIEPDAPQTAPAIASRLARNGIYADVPEHARNQRVRKALTGLVKEGVIHSLGRKQGYVRGAPPE